MSDDVQNNKYESDPPIRSQEADAADSALQLLRSIANAAASPENLEQAFLDWSRLSDDARTNPEFGYILTNIVAKSSGEEGVQSPDHKAQPESLSPSRFEDVFFLDANGVVVDISAELSDLLNIRNGDLIEPAVIQAHFETSQIAEVESEPTILDTIELRDRFNIKRRIVLQQLAGDVLDRRYAGIFMRLSLSDDAKEELGRSYGLTLSEVEILELAIQRYSPEQIAVLRNSKRNTVRTHISRLIQKMETRSLNEAIGLAVELSLAKTASPLSFTSLNAERDYSARKVTVSDQDAIVEYTRYGPPSGRPVVVLHSLEYGYKPTKEFIDKARERNICLYFPHRPGFGETTPTLSLKSAGDIMGGFLKALDINSAAIVALSTSAPLAVAIQNAPGRIDQIILVNYGLNAESKIDQIEPVWVRGLIKMALTAPSSYAVAYRAIRSFLKTFGTNRFYRMLYSAVDIDLEFMEHHLDLFEHNGTQMRDADRFNIRLDFMTAFMANRDLPHQISNHRSVVVANGEHQHMVSPESVLKSAETMGVSVEIIPNGGRHWPFVQTDALFDLVERYSVCGR